MVLPLKGLRVIDLTKDFAGPFCTMILADLGAEVIKIERPETGDETRAWGPPFVDGLSYYFLSLNRGKKSVTLDIKTKTAQKIIHRLVQDSDIFVESSRPGTLSRYGLGYPNLRRMNKALVYCSISSFGQTGPYRNLPGYDIIALAMSGIMSTTGERGRPPIRVSVPIADIAAGHYASTAILASLSRRLVTGQGEYIDIALYDSIVSWLTYLATYYSATGHEPLRMGSAHPTIVPYQAFNCKDSPLVVAVGNDSQWARLCRALDLEELSTRREFQTNPDRVHNRDRLVPIISRRLKTRNASYWNKLFNKNGVPSAPVYRIQDVIRDPQVRDRHLFTTSRNGIQTLNSPMRFSGAGRTGLSSAPKLGGNTSRVLREIGASRSLIKELAKPAQA